jgi:hypothetical protein
MARSQVTVAELSNYNTAGAVTADAVDVTNEHFIDITTLQDEGLLIRLYGGTGDGFTATFKAGDFPSGAIGDLDVAVAATETKIICLESARFKDSDEYILIDAASTGTATAATIECFSHA